MTGMRTVTGPNTQYSLFTREPLFSFCSAATTASEELRANGQIRFQNSTTTAKIAPSWITTRNISQNCALTSSVRNSFKRIICPVLLIGSHSVIPSTIPNIIAFKISVINTPFFS